MPWYAGVAQLVEQRIRNAKVGCSIPLTGTTLDYLNHVRVLQMSSKKCLKANENWF